MRTAGSLPAGISIQPEAFSPRFAEADPTASVSWAAAGTAIRTGRAQIASERMAVLLEACAPSSGAEQRGSPVHPGAERDHQHEVVRRHASVAHHFVPQQRDGGGRRVPVTLDVVVDLLV